MISLKKYIDGRTEESVRVLTETYRASLTAVGVGATQICPHLGEGFQQELLKLRDRLQPEAEPEAVADTGKQVEEELKKWGESASDYLQQTAKQVREIMLIVAQTAHAVAERDQQYAQQFGELAEQLTAIGNLDDLTKVRQSLGRSAQTLKAYVEKLVDDGAQSVSRLQAELSTYQTRLDEAERVATRDPVTGLANRYKAERQLQLRLELCQQNQSGKLSVILFDLDDFKQINDAYGHLAGDSLLAQFATELRSAFRQTDVVSRWGGDEFLAIVDCNAEEVRDRIAAARRWVDGDYTVPTNGDGKKVTVHASVGASTWSKGDNSEGLVARADAAMYQEKQGRKHAAKTPGTSTKAR